MKSLDSVIFLKENKESKEKKYHREHYFDNIGSKYTGKPTDIIPFNITESRRRASYGDLSFQQPKNNPNKSKLKKNENAKIIKKSILAPKFVPVKTSKENSNIDISNVNEENKQSKDSKKYSKLKIHYAKNQHAEINVYEDSNSAELTKQFWEKYKLASKMKSQLLLIIQNKIDSLKNKNNEKSFISENNDDSGEEMDQEALKHYQDEIGEVLTDNNKQAECKSLKVCVYYNNLE